MIVAELIAKLGEFDPSMTVVVYDGDDGACVVSEVDVQPFGLDQPDADGEVRAHHDPMGMFCVVIV